MIKVGDIGTVFRITLSDYNGILDISSATTTEINFRRADGGLLNKTATFTTDGTDGKLQYASIAGDLSVAGDWKMEAFIVMPSGSWTSNCIEFKVYDRCAS